MQVRLRAMDLWVPIEEVEGGDPSLNENQMYHHLKDETQVISAS
jgi:hypothetical protein